MTVRASIIIPHLNDQARLARCLDALMPQVAGDIEVLVVDNGSDAPVEPAQARGPSIRLITEPRKGAANSRNLGVAHARSDLLIFLDCDCVPAEDWLAAALSLANRDDIVGGCVTVFDETPPPRSGAEAFETVFAFKNEHYIKAKGFSVTANLITHRRVFAKIGGFRHGLSEDLEWCQRALGAGFGLTYAAELAVRHPTRSDWPAFERKWRRLTVEAWGLRGRSPADRAKWALRRLAMPVSIAAHLPKVLASPDLNSVRERWRAAATLCRIRLLRCRWMLRQAAGLDI